ncbi:MAG: ROK family protein [Betaproteobacteria bacterium]|nr:ROK family protein [Betaproteobacteria bacterium]
MIRIGIDLGGTKIELLALDAQGSERLRKRIATPRDSYEETVDAIVSLVNQAEAELGQTGTVGVATPGAVSRKTGMIKNANSTRLNGRPLVQDLQARLTREIRIENDANCFALSEATDGAAAGGRNVFGVILGTGVGGGLVIDKRVVTGANAIAGEWGHNPLPSPRDEERPGLACYCGRQGCIETWLSGPGMARHFHAQSGRDVSAADIAAQAPQDPACELAMQAYEDRLARALASVINMLDPDAIVLGGGLSNIARLYANVPKIWSRYIFSDQVETRLLAPRFGDASGVRGAAWLWNDARQ